MMRVKRVMSHIASKGDYMYIYHMPSESNKQASKFEYLQVEGKAESCTFKWEDGRQLASAAPPEADFSVATHTP